MRSLGRANDVRASGPGSAKRARIDVNTNSQVQSTSRPKMSLIEDNDNEDDYYPDSGAQVSYDEEALSWLPRCYGPYDDVPDHWHVNLDHQEWPRWLQMLCSKLAVIRDKPVPCLGGKDDGKLHREGMEKEISIVLYGLTWLLRSVRITSYPRRPRRPKLNSRHPLHIGWPSNRHLP
jgi:hypothetical protein